MTVRSLQLLVGSTPNALDPHIQAYALVIFEKGNEAHSASGSINNVAPNYACLKAISEAMTWCERNLPDMSEITIYMPNPKLLSHRIDHLITEGTLPVRDTIEAHLQGRHYRWCAKSLQECLISFTVIERLKHESGQDPALASLSDEANLAPVRGGITREVVWDGRKCGSVLKGVYVSRRRDCHFCDRHQGWGIQKCVADMLRDMGVHTIEMHYTGKRGRAIFSSSFKDFVDNAIPDCLNPDDGDQLFLPLAKWKEKRY